MSHDTHMNESWHTNELVMFTQSYTRAGEPARMNDSTRVNETWHKYIWVMRHGTNTYESWDMAQVHMSHETWYKYIWVIPKWMSGDTQSSATAGEPVWMNHSTRVSMRHATITYQSYTNGWAMARGRPQHHKSQHEKDWYYSYEFVMTHI